MVRPCHFCGAEATREMLVPPAPMPPLADRLFCQACADHLQATAFATGILLAHVPLAPYEPPRATPVGNVHDLLAYVCPGGECDPD